MKVSLEYLEDNKFKANTSKSNYIMDCNKITPVEYFATALIGCSGIDIVTFAKKDGYDIKNYKIEANIIRNDKVPYKFNKVEIIYSFDGEFEDIKAKRYILSSLESYCTTINSIRDSVKIYYTLNYNNKIIVNKESIISGTANRVNEAVIENGFGGACCS